MGAGCCSSKAKVHFETPEYEWQMLLKSNKLESLVKNDPKKIKQLLYRGIPKSLRWEVWREVLATEDLKAEYNTLLSSTTMDSQIEKDINRTFPTNALISSDQGQQSLKKLLNVLAKKFPTQGYWQGMNYITGITLIISLCNEFESFEFLSALYKDFGVLQLFEEKFQRVRQYCLLFHETLEKYDSGLQKHCVEIGLDDSLWVFKWFITMFSYSFDYNDVLRIWDAIISENLGFMVNIAVSIALSVSKRIMDRTLEETLSVIEKLSINVEQVLSKAKVIEVKVSENQN